jgi:hypothetical protein
LLGREIIRAAALIQVFNASLARIRFSSYIDSFPKGEFKVFKKKINSASFILAAAFAMLCWSSIPAVGQKGNQSTEGAPLKGVDIKLGKNPGGRASARTIQTDKDGKFHLGILEKGSWYLIVSVPRSEAASAQNDDVYVVTLTGSAGGETKWEWNIKTSSGPEVARKIISADDNVHPSMNSQGRATKPVVQDRITFESDGATPCDGAIVRSKSNISNNRTATP